MSAAIKVALAPVPPRPRRDLAPHLELLKLAGLPGVLPPAPPAREFAVDITGPPYVLQLALALRKVLSLHRGAQLDAAVSTRDPFVNADQVRERVSAIPLINPVKAGITFRLSATNTTDKTRAVLSDEFELPPGWAASPIPGGVEVTNLRPQQTLSITATVQEAGFTEPGVGSLAVSGDNGALGFPYIKSGNASSFVNIAAFAVGQGRESSFTHECTHARLSYHAVGVPGPLEGLKLAIRRLLANTRTFVCESSEFHASAVTVAGNNAVVPLAGATPGLAHLLARIVFLSGPDEWGLCMNTANGDDSLTFGLNGAPDPQKAFRATVEAAQELEGILSSLADRVGELEIP